MLAATVPEFVQQVLPTASARYSFVQVLACGQTLKTVGESLAASYQPVSSGAGFAIFRRR